MSDLPPILAVSSPPGRSARGIIRITGDDLSKLVAAALDLPPIARRLTPCTLKARGLPSPGPRDTRRSIHLPVLALMMPAGSSFTGSDILELQLPGNPALLERVLHALLDALRELDPDARLAEPGEFTRRAFAAGRIDLTRAEGIAATIGATTDAQLRAAAMLRTGRLGRWSADLVDALAQSLALVEAGIDFVDQDDVVPITPGDLDARLGAIEAELRGLAARSRSWSSLESLPWVVLVGPPNSGKSTLFNALLGRERAVVSDVAGTTRDVLTEPLAVEDGEVMLVDVAGLDTPLALLDAAMQRAARAAIGRGDLIVRLGDAVGVDLPPDTPVIDVHSKCDLIATDDFPQAGLRVSAVSGEGLDALRDAIAVAVRDRAVSLSAEMFALRPRHRAELDAAIAELVAARSMLAPQREAAALSDAELIADRMRRTLDALGAIGGSMTPDDVIGKVFATFCVGK